jgi:hypothetical protein
MQVSINRKTGPRKTGAGLIDVAKQARYALTSALNSTAFDIQRAERKAMLASFENPVSPYVLNSVRVKKADIGNLRAIVEIDPLGLGGGATPEDILQAEVFGGRRGYKGAERRLQTIGLMPPGWYMVPSPAFQRRDRFGNVPGPFIRRLLSYFSAFTEAGFAANMKPATRARIAKKRRTERGFIKIEGVEYFIAQQRTRDQHLKPGIYARTGIHGANITPVFIFVPRVSYPVRFKFFEVAQNIVDREFPGHFDRAFRHALATARGTP